MNVIPFLLLFGGCAGYGIACAREYEMKYRELLYFKQVISNLIITLKKGRYTFGECCFEVALSSREPYKKIFMSMYESLENERMLTLGEIWQRGVRMLAEELKMKELETLRQCVHFGDTSFVEQPVEALIDVNYALEQLIYQTEKVKKDRSRLAICLGLSAGILLCLLFW